MIRFEPKAGSLLLAGCVVAILAAVSVANVLAQDDRGFGVRRASSSAEKRVALLIGNTDYPTAPLKNPANDARAMAQALREVGFDVVIEKLDATQREMDDAVEEFAKQITNKGVAFFFYAGHGVQVNSRNYLIPVDARISSEKDVKYKALDAQWVVDRMDEAGAELKIVILDACRNNPFTRSSRSSVQGLAAMDPADGTILTYATAPGSVASDGTGDHGLFTEKFLRHMKTPGLDVFGVFQRVGKDVRQASGNKQKPWLHTSYVGDFYFVSPKASPPAAPPRPALPVSEASGVPSQGAVSSVTAMGTLQVYCDQPGCVVTVDGKQAGKTVMGQWLQVSTVAKELEVVVSKEGFEEVREQFVLLPGPPHQIVAQLAGSKVPAATVATVGAPAATPVLRPLSELMKKAVVVIRSNVENDDILIDGTSYGPTTNNGRRIELNAGPHTIEVRKEGGYTSWKKEVRLQPGEELPLFADVVKSAGSRVQRPAVSGPAYLVVRSNVSNDALSINGKSHGATGPRAIPLAPGEYSVMVEKKGYERWEELVTLAPGETRTLRAQLARIGSTRAHRSVASSSVGNGLAGRWITGAYEANGAQGTLTFDVNLSGGAQVSATAVVVLQMANPSGFGTVQMSVYRALAGSYSGNQLWLQSDNLTVTNTATGQTESTYSPVTVQGNLSANGMTLTLVWNNGVTNILTRAAGFGGN